MKLKTKHFALCLCSLPVLLATNSFCYEVKAQEGSATTTTTTTMTAEDHFNRAGQLDAEGQHHEAIAEYTKAIELNPNFAEAYFYRGNSYSLLPTPNYNHAKGDLEKARSIYQAHGKTEAVQIVEGHKLIIEAGIHEDHSGAHESEEGHPDEEHEQDGD